MHTHADDTVQVIRSMRALVEVFEALVTEVNFVGLQINDHKIKYMKMIMTNKNTKCVQIGIYIF